MRVKAFREKSDEKSGISTVGKVLLNTELEMAWGGGAYEPRNNKFYDAFATFIMWHLILEGDKRSVKFYVSNGFDTSVKIESKTGQIYTLPEFAIKATIFTTNAKLQNSFLCIARYLGERLEISSKDGPIFSVTQDEKSVEFTAHTHYQSGNYNCMINQNGDVIYIMEFYEDEL
ncbi:MAG: hypothetical protein KGH61_04570 [Candidatus Micrarchaeota archaeon]|nr:hypothetical protein [Candidatus Micrarchaeota archaeon]MDE1848191.1 hypothetical protein [Candidatus Micrarchaeota archaeon]MDE1864838.1 hypothetical protein [Candidatus Micrarchaeota archaeon]